jgi:nucleoside-diphosphate-sugar epimerase
VRAADSSNENINTTVIGPIDNATDWAVALRGVNVAIHLAARVHVMKNSASDPLAEFLKVNLHGTANLARQAAQAGVKRLVYVSSIKVNGEKTHEGQKYSETSPPAPHDPYAISKWEAEQALHRVAGETSLEVVIVRPPLVYGPGVKGNFAQMLNVVAKRIPLPLASVLNQRSLIYVGNLADALIACATHSATAGQTYLVCDGEDISTPDLLRQLATGMGVPSRLFPCPPALLRLAGKLTGKSQQVERLLGSLQIDDAKIRRELNWHPPFSLDQGLQATALAYLHR